MGRRVNMSALSGKRDLRRTYETAPDGLSQAVGHLSECAAQQANAYDTGFVDRRCTCLSWCPE